MVRLVVGGLVSLVGLVGMVGLVVWRPVWLGLFEWFVWLVLHTVWNLRGGVLRRLSSSQVSGGRGPEMLSSTG